MCYLSWLTIVFSVQSLSEASVQGPTFLLQKVLIENMKVKKNDYVLYSHFLVPSNKLSTKFNKFLMNHTMINFATPPSSYPHTLTKYNRTYIYF